MFCGALYLAPLVRVCPELESDQLRTVKPGPLEELPDRGGQLVFFKTRVDDLGGLVSHLLRFQAGRFRFL